MKQFIEVAGRIIRISDITYATRLPIGSKHGIKISLRNGTNIEITCADEATRDVEFKKLEDSLLGYNEYFN